MHNALKTYYGPALLRPVSFLRGLRCLFGAALADFCHDVLVLHWGQVKCVVCVRTCALTRTHT